MGDQKNSIGKPRLLFVEDDKVTIDVFKLFIGDRYQTDWAETGEVSLTKANENDYDVFLMDIGLPGKLNGIETTKKLKEIKNNKDKPFIAITAYAMKGDKEYLISQGLTHYLMKPFDRQKLINIIEDALEE